MPVKLTTFPSVSVQSQSTLCLPIIRDCYFLPFRLQSDKNLHCNFTCGTQWGWHEIACWSGCKHKLQENIFMSPSGCLQAWLAGLQQQSTKFLIIQLCIEHVTLHCVLTKDTQHQHLFFSTAYIIVLLQNKNINHQYFLNERSHLRLFLSNRLDTSKLCQSSIRLNSEWRKRWQQANVSST